MLINHSRQPRPRDMDLNPSRLTAKGRKKAEALLEPLSTTTSSLSTHVCSRKHCQRLSWKASRAELVGESTETRPGTP